MWERIEEVMAAKGIKTADLHKATGIPYSSFTDWKRANKVPKLDKLQQIADFLEVPVDYLSKGTVQTNEQAQEYPINEDAKRILQALAKRPDIMKFVQAAVQAAPEDVTAATDVLLALIRRTK